MVYEGPHRFLSTIVSTCLGHWKKGQELLRTEGILWIFLVCFVFVQMDRRRRGMVCEDFPALYVVVTLSE